MKKLIFLNLLLIVTVACSEKTETPAPDNSTTGTNPSKPGTDGITPAQVTTDFSKQKKLTEATFKTGAHTTSGKAFVYEDAAGVRTLVFENFKTDAGPDLRIFLATDLKAKSVTEVSKKVENGNQMYTIPKEVDLAKQANVLIWCKQFSVLFGSASF
jgi:uncharacterized protein YcfL